MPDIVCISPVDGREVVRRASASASEIEAAIGAGRKAQAEWKRVPIAERGTILSKAVDAMLAMRDEIAPELAWQMGRPIRYGGNELNGFEERARAMIALAESALGDIVPELIERKRGSPLVAEQVAPRVAQQWRAVRIDWRIVVPSRALVVRGVLGPVLILRPVLPLGMEW